MKIHELLARDPRTHALANSGQARITSGDDERAIKELRAELETFVCDGQYGSAIERILSSYLTAYSIRIYIMNYYKNTAGKGVKRDNRAFFGIEQISASLTLVVAGVAFFNAPAWFGYEVVQVTQFRAAILDPNPLWLWAGLAGSAFGLVAFFSVFIFMYKGRTATFAGLVNRLTSLLAGTTATLLFWGFFGGKFPETKDWVSLVFILVAVGFLTMAERQRARELEAEA